MNISIITAPASEPVTLSDAKNYCKVDAIEDEDLIAALITSARQQAEQYTRRALVTQTLEVSYDLDDLGNWPMVDLYRPPVASVTSIKCYDANDVECIVDPSKYRVSGDCVIMAWGAVWPSYLRERDAMIIRYVAGYGAATAVPEQIKTAIKRIVQDLYDNRGDQLTGTISASVELTARKLLDPFKVYRL